jgi:hypothetical protein
LRLCVALYWKFTCTEAITSYKSYQNSAPRACSYYQFHSRAGKMKIKNVNLRNYVTQTVTYLYEQEEKTNRRFRVQPVFSSLSKLLWRGRTRGGEKHVYAQPWRLRASPLPQQDCDGFASCRTTTRETRVIRNDRTDLAADAIWTFLLVVPVSLLLLSQWLLLIT